MTVVKQVHHIDMAVTTAISNATFFTHDELDQLMLDRMIIDLTVNLIGDFTNSKYFCRIERLPSGVSTLVDLISPTNENLGYLGDDHIIDFGGVLGKGSNVGNDPFVRYYFDLKGRRTMEKDDTFRLSTFGTDASSYAVVGVITMFFVVK